MAKGKTGFIWGRRIVGDQVMGFDPVTGKLGRLYSPAAKIVGGVEQDFMAVSATPNYAVGGKMMADEAIHRYCLNGGVQLAAGILVQSPLPDAAYLAMALVANTLPGATSFTITVPAGVGIVANQYVGGYLGVDGGTGAQGLGTRLRILSHGTVVAGGGPVTFVTVDPAPVAFTAGATTFQLMGNPYNLVIVPPALPTAKVVGATPRIVPANNYFWLISKGPSMLLNTTGVPVSGMQIVASLTVGGTFDTLAAAWVTTSIVGRVIRTGINGSQILCDIQCE